MTKYSCYVFTLYIMRIKAMLSLSNKSPVETRASKQAKCDDVDEKVEKNALKVFLLKHKS